MRKNFEEDLVLAEKERDNFDRVITFRPTEKLAAWLSGASEKARQSGVKFNLSELIKSRLELSVDLVPDVIAEYDGYDFAEGLSAMLRDSSSVLLNIRKKVIGGTPLTQNEFYFLFYQLHRAYASCRQSVYISELILQVVEAFEVMFNAAVASKWKLPKDDYYFANNFAQYEVRPNKKLGSHQETKDRVEITKKRILGQGLLCSDGAEYYSRGLEVLLLKTRMEAKALNDLLEPYKFAFLLLASKEVSIRADNSALIDEADLLPKNFYKKLEVQGCSVSVSTYDGKYSGEFIIVQGELEIRLRLNFSDLEDTAKTFVSGQKSAPVSVTHWSFPPEKFEVEFEGRSNISVSPEMYQQMLKLFELYLNDPEIRQIRMIAGQSYGVI